MKALAKTVALAIVFSFIFIGDVSAQGKTSKSRSGKSKSSTSSSKKDSNKNSSRKKSSGRLPRYFAHLKLDDDQREEVYAVQSKYKKQIADLMEELDELKEEQQDELYDLLSRTQKTLYNKYVAGTLKVGDKLSTKESDPDKKTSKKSSSRKSASRKPSS